VYARRNICANLEVCRPQEHLCTPRLREAATTLSASGGLRVRTARATENKVESEVQFDRETLIL
jgi:hypothetical protein